MTNRAELQAYLDRPLDDLMDELSLYAPTERSPADVWAKIAGPVRQRLCVEWDYCTVRQDARWGDDLDLAAVVVGVLSARALNLPIPADLLLVSTIVVKRGLDAFCGCFDLAADQRKTLTPSLTGLLQAPWRSLCLFTGRLPWTALEEHLGRGTAIELHLPAPTDAPRGDYADGQPAPPAA